MPSSALADTTPQITNGAHMSDNNELLLARVLPESELTHTGKAAKTGLQLTIPFSILSGHAAELIAATFGYSSTQLDHLSSANDALVMVVAPAHPDAGRASVETLAGLMRDLCKQEGPFTDDEIAEAVDTLSSQAGSRVHQAQQALSRVFGLRGSVFGHPRFSSVRWPERQLIAPFYLDEKIDLAAISQTRNPLKAGTALALEEYPSLPMVHRLAWPPK